MAKLRIALALLVTLLLTVLCFHQFCNLSDPPPDYVIAEADRVAATVKSHQTDNTFSFIAMTDTHLYESYEDSIMHAGQAAALIRQSVEIDFATLLGDVTYGSAKTTLAGGIEEINKANNYLASAFAGIPNFRTTGNHDALTYSYTLNNDYLTNAELFPYIGQFNSGAVHGSTDGGYCYRDFEEHKIRVILLNTSDLEGVTVTENTGYVRMSGAQVQWFAESLDLSAKADASEWGVIILSHMPLDYGVLLRSAGKVLDAYVTGSSTAFTWEGQAVSYDYSGKNTSEIIANLHGHNHCFRVDEMYICNQADRKYKSSIERICIPNACVGRENERGRNNALDVNQIEFGDKGTYEKTVNSAKDTAFNIVTVDREKQLIYCDNYGAGYDRLINYYDDPAAPRGNYTNVVSSAQPFESLSILNDTGYQDGSYLSTATNHYGNDQDCVLVGCIRYDVPETGLPSTIYIRGGTIDDSPHVRFFITSSEKRVSVYAGNGSEIPTYFDIEVLGDQYYKLTPVASGETSMIFASQTYRIHDGSYVALSVKGRGQDLIITFDEPIE